MFEINYSQNIKIFRQKKGLTQKELAEILDVKPTAVSAWELGRNKPLMDKVTLMANLFNVTTSDIIGDTFISDNINSIYNQLEESRQTKVYNYATQQLKEQNQTNVVELPKEEFAEDPTMVIAAHMDDDASEEEKEEVRQFIQNLKDERKNK